MGRFQDLRLLRFIARASFLAVVIVYLTSYCASNGEMMKTWEASFLPELLRDLNGIGLLAPDADCVVFLRDHTAQISNVFQNLVEPVNVEDSAEAIGTGSLDFVFAASDDSGFRFADSALKIGGVAAVQIGHCTDEPFCIPCNFQIVYIWRFSSTVIAMQKVGEAPASILITGARTERRMDRRLLAVPEAKRKPKTGLRLWRSNRLLKGGCDFIG